MRRVYLATIAGLTVICAAALADKQPIAISARDITSVEVVDLRVIVSFTREKSEELTARGLANMSVRFADLNVPTDILRSISIRQIVTSPEVFSLTFELPDEAKAKRLADALHLPVATN